MGNILNIINSDKHFYDFDGGEASSEYIKCMDGSFYSEEIKDHFEMKVSDIDSIVDDKKYIYLIECGTVGSVYRSFSKLPQKIIDMTNQDRCKVVIAFEQEGDLDIIEFNQWYKRTCRLRESEVKFSNFYILHSERTCKDKNETPINFFPSTFYFDRISYFLLQLKRDNNFQEFKEFDYTFKVNTIDDIDLEKKSKHFLTFMRTCKRPHRIALAAYYEYNKLWESNNISFLRVGLGKEEIEFPNILDKKYYSSYKEVIHRDIVELDTKKIKAQHESFFEEINELTIVYKFTDKWELYQETFLSVVSETRFDIETVVMSEKITKPLYNLHPFIVTASPFFLKELKELGFKTFSPFIDESYDNEMNHKKRMNMIFDELDRFRKISIQELKDWWKEILPILEHNQETFFNMARKKTKKTKLLERFCE